MAVSRVNSERYPDPTAYLALTAVERSERSLMRKKARRKKGRTRKRTCFCPSKEGSSDGSVEG